MAANLMWLKNDVYSANKMIIWTANTHVAKGTKKKKPEWMGEWLQSLCVDGYTSLSFQQGKSGKPFSLPGSTISYATSTNEKFDVVIYLNKLKKIAPAEWITPCD